VRAFKFSRRFALRRVLEDLVVEAFDRFYSEATNGVRAVVPVPCRRSTLRRRGFDLPALLARRLARSRALSWRPEALMKLADTPDLVRLGAAARVRAVKRAYAPRESLEGPVLLVDDVVTSTATARACARSCLDAGADRVLVLALARTPREIR
jgi:predicted amidophosphoribosyltransferase